MTNAEKIAKDTALIVELIAGYDCYTGCKDCKDCVVKARTGFCGGSFDEEKIREWLEREVEE